jgi:hypothetical protein
MDVIIPAEANVRSRSIGIVGRDQLGLCEVGRDGFTASLVSKIGRHRQYGLHESGD